MDRPDECHERLQLLAGVYDIRNSMDIGRPEDRHFDHQHHPARRHPQSHHNETESPRQHESIVIQSDRFEYFCMFHL